MRAHVAAREHELKLLVGSQFLVGASSAMKDDAPFTLVVLACDLAGYGNLCEFITRQRRAAPKGSYRLSIGEIDLAALTGCVVLAAPDRRSSSGWLEAVTRDLIPLLGRLGGGSRDFR